MGEIFIYSLLLGICLVAVFRPHVGIIGYFGWVALRPEFLWRWTLPPDSGLQKYIVAATIIGWLLRGLPGNQVRGPALFACIGLLIYLLISWISSFQTAEPERTAFFMSVIWKIVLMTLLAVKLLDSEKKIELLIWATVLAHAFNAYEINLQYFQDGYSWALQNGWGFNDSNTYSIASLPSLGFAAILLFISDTYLKKSIAAVCFVLLLHQLFLLESRGCMIGAALMLGIIWWYVPKSFSITTTVLVLIIVGAALAGPPIVQEFKSIFTSEDVRDSSAESRFGLWEAGWEITKDNPLLGVGPWGAETIVPRYYPGEVGERKALHNLLFEVSTGSGVPAALAYIGFFFLPWFVVFRKNRVMSEGQASCLKLPYLAVVSTIPAYWLSSMFSSGILIETGYLCAAIGIAIICLKNSLASLQTNVLPNRGQMK